MSQVSRPVQIALGATLVFALLWFVALRPKADGGGAAPAPPAAAAPGAEGLSSAARQAQDAVATANGDAQRAAASDAEGGAGSAAAAAPRASGGHVRRASGGQTRPATVARVEPTGGAGAARRATPSERRTAAGPVRTALRQHKALALAFVDPRTADARAVRDELRAVSRFGGRAVAIAVPIAELSRYAFITRDVQVTVAPTVVIVSPKRVATTIVGFADRGEIEQGLADALAARRGR